MIDPSIVLIADDEPQGRENLEVILAERGYQLVFASDGQEALDQAVAVAPDLILLDVMMPRLDGFEVCRRLRATPKLADVPIILITALDDRESRLRGIESGADEFLTKPFDRHELRARVRTITRLNRYRRLLAERAKSEQLIELSPDAILIVDVEGVVRLANPAAEQMIRPGRSLINERFDRLVMEAQRPAWNGRLQELHHTPEKVLRLETEFLRMESVPFPVEISARSLLWGQESAVTVHVRDLTEKKKLEAQLLRTQRLQTLGSLAEGIARDLSTVLTPILMGVTVLKSAVQGAKELHAVQVMEGSAQRGVDIIRQIEAFAGGSEGVRTPLQVKYLLQDVERLLGDLLPASIELHTECTEATAGLVGDGLQLHQVLMNLCVNARDAMPQGGTLRLLASNVMVDPMQAQQILGATPGRFVRIMVSDTGIGMAPDMLSRIFEPFFTTKEAAKGAGLGLSTAQSIVKAHGGFITVESEPGRGSRFHVCLPAAASEATEQYRSQELPRGNGETILMAEDDSAVREIIQATLENAGYRVLAASDGTEAVALYGQHLEEVKVLLTDVVMPYLDGPATVQAVLRMNPTARCVIMSGSVEREQLASLAHLKSVSFLTKPFTAESLLKRLANTLQAA